MTGDNEQGSVGLLGLLLELLHLYLFGLLHLLQLLLVDSPETNIEVNILEVVCVHSFQVVLLAQILFLSHLLTLHKILIIIHDWMQAQNIVESYAAPQWCLSTCDGMCQQNFYYYGFRISLIFSVLTLGICLYVAWQHLRNFNNPYFQAKIVLIVLMPPVFCTTSTLSFLSVRWSSYITLARDIYELFGLTAFFYLILAFLAYDHDKNTLDEKRLYAEMQESGAVSHDYPCNNWLKSYQLSNWHKANYFVVRCKKALLQFILIKIATSILMCIVYPEYQLHIHTQPTWDYIIYNRLNTSVYWITTISSYFAYYYMSMFYSGMHKQLMPFKPDLKFITFNSTMYYTYWQKVWMVFFQNRLIACFDHQTPVFYSKKLMYCIENLLICIEMFFMALATLQAYDHRDYVVPNSSSSGSVIYVIKDILRIVSIELKLMTPTPKFKTSFDFTQNQILAADGDKKGAPRPKVKVKAPISSQSIQDYF